jgi:NADH-quinone oxidoreductase subunit N
MNRNLEMVLSLLPVILLVTGGLVVLLSEVFLVSGRRGYQVALTVAFSAAAALSVLASPGVSVFAKQAVADGFSAFVTVTVCAGLALSALLGAGWLHARGLERGEFYALALFGAAGMSLLGMATDLVVAFIAIEVMSLATYSLAAYQRRGRKPAEAAFKYFLLGAFSSAIFLYGTALVFGAAESTLFSALAAAPGTLLLAGLVLVIVGLGFKVAAVPFHTWAPDVYEGAPTPVTAFMAAGVKVAAFAVLARLMIAVYDIADPTRRQLFGVVSALAILTMFFGNLLALPQKSVKRMLAYSSIAHAGYLLVAVVTLGVSGARPAALAGLLYYLASYTATVIGAFAVVAALEGRGRTADEELEDAWDLSRFAGLGRRRPALALAMAVFMISLAGIPPTAGFVGKLLIFQTAVQGQVYLLAIFGVLTSVLGAYYYLRVVVYMYMRAPEGDEELAKPSPAISFAVAVAAAAVMVLGITPEPIARLAKAVAATAGF